MRITERAHADAAAAWEQAEGRPYDRTVRGEGAGAELAAWDQALVDEGVSADKVSGTLVLDLEKAFEHVEAMHLWRWGPALRLDPCLISLMIAVFTMPRSVQCAGAIQEGAVTTYWAAVAGSIFGTRALKIVA